MAERKIVIFGIKLSVRLRIMGGFLAVVMILLVNLALAWFWDSFMLMILGGAISVVLSLVIGWFLSSWIVGNMSKLQETMSRAGLGDLTAQAEVKSNDEFGDLGAAFNVMITRLASLVGQVRNLTEELAAASEEIAASSEEVSASITDVSESMQNVASEAEKGNQSILEASQVLLELSSLTAISKKQSESAHVNSQNTLQSAEKGKVTVETAVERMARIREKTLETEELMVTLNDLSKQIDTITATISGLADQTNLLALNAAIEAARAGESGRGFAVVAEEVRKLAEQSTQGAKDVASLVQKVLVGVNSAVEATKLSRDEVENGVIIMNQAGEALEGILQAVRQTAEDVRYTLKVTDSEVASSDKVVRLIDSVATVIEKTSNHAEEVASSSEEVNASMENVAGGIQQATLKAQELFEDVEHFKLDNENLTTAQILEKAKTAHLLWKSRIVNMMKGLETVTPEEVTSHTHCNLGKWYTSKDNPFKNEAEYKELDHPHHMVHQMAQEAAKAYQAGDLKTARHCLKQLDRESGKVIQYLNRLIDKAD